MRKIVKDTDKKYVVVKEPLYDFVRLRKSDSIEILNLLILWEGNNLRKGYDAMIYFNREDKNSRTRFFAMVQHNGILKIHKCTYPESLDFPWYEIPLFEVDEEKKSIKNIKNHWSELLINLKNRAKLDLSKKLTLSDMRYLCWKYCEDPSHLFLPV